MANATPPQAVTPRRASKMASNQSLNLNHLLNFTLPPRQTQPPPSLPRRSRKTAQSQGFWNKERFVNAQYRFIMDPTGDYTVHFADPDIFFQWQDILQVIIPRSSALASASASANHLGEAEGHTTCPICLSPPTAPRMTKCGHVYCFPCILHYLNTSENKWARCPICFDSVNEKQLKSVKWYDGPKQEPEETHAESSSASSLSALTLDVSPRAGSTMRMRLMQRPQITTLALPRSPTWPSDLLPPHQAPFHFLPDVSSYAKFMLATPSYLIADLSRDLDELVTERRTFSGMNDDLGLSFVDAADRKVRDQLSKAAALETPLLQGKIEKAHRDLREVQDRFAFRERRRKEVETSQSTADEVPAELLALKSEPAKAAPLGRNAPKQRRNLNPPPPTTSTYYYYQASSGLPIFLHPLDIKILLSYFKSYSSFPDSITVRVEAMSEGTVNDDLRKRCKYLGHMPEGADVVFIEADLHGVVSADGLKNFENALKMRSSRRKEKGKKDDRAKARAEGRERERRDHEVVTALSWGPEHFTSAPQTEPIIVDPEEAEATPPPPREQVSGAWGARSFASALHSGNTGPRPTPRIQRDEQDEWDMDAAWHELEQRNSGGGGGRRKRSNKLVVLGGGARRR